MRITKRKLWWFFASVASLATVLVVFLLVREATAERISALACQQPLYDFGTVQMGQASLLKHTFTLQNESDHSVKILDSRASCGCTVTKIEGDHVDSHGSLKVPVEIKWGDRSGPQSAVVWVRTDEPSKPTITLKVSADIFVPLSVYPDRIDFGKLSPGQSPEVVLNIGKMSTMPRINIVSANGNQPSLKVRLIDRSDTEDASIVVGHVGVSLSAGNLPEHFFGVIEVKTSSSERPIHVPVFAVFCGPLEAKPTSIVFNLSADAPSRKTAILTVHAFDASILGHLRGSISSPVPDGVFSVQPIPAQKGNACAFLVTCDTSKMKNSVAVGKVLVSHDSTTLTVPLFATVGSPSRASSTFTSKALQ